MNEYIVGLDWDDLPIEQAKKKQLDIERQENTGSLLFQTQHGFHLLIIYDKPKKVSENFKIREQYNDDAVRLQCSKKRYSLTGQGYDILFNKKQGFWRKIIWKE